MSEPVTDRSTAPKITIPESIHITPARPHKLSNGKNIYILNHGLPDLVRFEAVFDAGKIKAPNPVLSDLTNAMLDEGTKNHSSRRLAEKLDFLAANLKLNVGKHTASLTVHSLKKHFDKVAGLVSEIISHPAFYEEELEIVRRQQYQNFLIRREYTDKLASDRFWEVIFGEKHPYGISVRPEDYQTIKAGDLKEFHARNYRPETALFIFSGRPDKQTEATLDKHLHAFAPGSAKGFAYKNESLNPHADKKHFVHKNDAVQASVRMGKAAINKTHPDYIKLSIVNTVLGGYFGSRLMTNIREDKGYTYGIFSSLGSLLGSGYFLISAETRQESVKDVTREIRKELRKLREELMPREELAVVKHYTLGVLLENFDGIEATARAFKSVHFYGLDKSWYQGFIDTLKTISPEDIRETAEKYLHENSMYEVVCADKNKA